MLKIGSHVSFSKNGLYGSVIEAISYNANSFMFYTGAPQNTVRKEINMIEVNKAKDLMNQENINIKDVICHAPYIINLATAKKEQWDFSVEFLNKEIERCKLMGVKNIVVHPGNAVGILRSEGLQNIVNALKILVNEDVTILLETMAGKGTELCSNIDELKYVLESVNHNNLGVCLDTCHLNDSGIDISNFDLYLDEFDKNIGINKIGCIHVNDSKNNLGEKKDRHENFGFGTIGFDSLIKVIYNEKLKDVPKILETPYVGDYPPYKHEIEMIKSKVFNSNLKAEIISYFNK